MATLQDLQTLITSETTLLQNVSGELTSFAAAQQQFDADLQALIAWAKNNGADPQLIQSLADSQTANNQAFSDFATKLQAVATTLANEDAEVQATDGQNQSMASQTTAVNQPPNPTTTENSPSAAGDTPQVQGPVHGAK